MAADLEATGAYQPSEEPTAEDHLSQIGEYRILNLLGAGGMGRVFAAEPIAGGSPVAVKILSSKLMANPVSVERFRQEGRLAAQIAHPRCVFVLGADADRGRPYIVMELMPGDTLKDLVDKKGPLSPAEAIRLTLDVIDGLMEAHRLGVVHRDIKPSNCFMVPDGRVKIGDFGLSKSLGSDTQLTQSGAFLGTILFASPEQIRGEPVDFASDVYSLGATLFYLLTGRAPFQHENPTAVLAKIISEDPPSLREINRNLPSDLTQVVQKSLERDRSRRFANLAEFKSALVALIPEQLTFGGMGIRIGAYVLDEILVRLLLIAPVQIALTTMTEFELLAESITLSMFALYFMITEGLFGRSLGKAILRLKVCRQGTTMPPGFRLAAIRTIVFSLLFTLTFLQIPLVFEKLAAGRSIASLFLNLVPFGVGLAILVVPMRTRNDFRGLHELLSSTCVMRLPLRPGKIRLKPSRVDRLAEIPRRPTRFPETIGSYSIQRAMKSENDWIAIGEDPSLGRAVLLHLTSPAQKEHKAPLGRPGRLWFLGTGNMSFAGESFRWNAYVAPVGSPLVDAVDRKEPVRWPEARPIIEQLTEELLLAEQNGTLPKPTSLEQIWVQSDGRVQLMEFPLKPTSGLSSLEIVRQSSAVLLEGAPRATNDRRPYASPLPRHAERALAILNDPKGNLSTLTKFDQELKATAHLPSKVSRPLRVIQLAILCLLSLLPWTVLFGVSAFVNLIVGLNDDVLVDAQKNIVICREMLHAMQIGEAWVPSDLPPDFQSKLENRLSAELAKSKEMYPGMTTFESFGIMGIVSLQVDDATIAAQSRQLVKTSVTPVSYSNRHISKIVNSTLLWPIVPAIFAFLSKGLFIRLLFGMTLVRTRGGLASRRQHMVKSLLFWTPVCLINVAVVWIRVRHPEFVFAWNFLWWGSLAMIPIGIGFCLVNPDRSPLDRLARTWMVPG